MWGRERAQRAIGSLNAAIIRHCRERLSLIVLAHKIIVLIVTHTFTDTKVRGL